MNKRLLFRSRWMTIAALLGAALLLTNCGGGGGGGTLNELNIVGDVFAPNGTPRSRSIGGSALPNATVRAYRLQNLDQPIAQTQTDASGRYTLVLPAQYRGADLVIMAVKTVQNRTVRLMTLLAALPPEGKMGVNLNAYTTLAGEEILKLVQEGDLASPLSPNGVATVIEQVRQRIDEMAISSLDLSVGGGVLPDKPGDGLQGSLGNTVREIVRQQRVNLPGSTNNDVATAKRMTQMVRDMAYTFLGTGDDEGVSIEEAIHRQETIVRTEIVTPTEAFAQRLRLIERVLGFDDFSDSLLGKPPGHYREEPGNGWQVSRLTRIGDTDNHTWRVDSTLPETNGMTLTLRTQNPLAEFDWTPDAGSYTLTVRQPSDRALQYDGSLRVLARDSNGNPTRIGFDITLRDRELRAPLQFSGEASGVPRSGGYYSSLQFSGTLTSQYGSLTIEGLRVEFYPSGHVQRIQLAGVRLQDTTSRPPSSLQASNLSLTLTDARSDPSQLSIGNLTLQEGTLSLKLTNWQATIVQVDGENLPRTAAGRLEYRSDEASFSGSFNGEWKNPRPDQPLRNRDEVPRGRFSFEGTLTPRYGATVRVQLTLTSEPTGSAPEVRLSIRLNYGSESIEGNLDGTLHFTNGSLDRHTPFEPIVLNLTHRPSNFRLEARGTGGRNRHISGAIKKPTGEDVAHIGRASALGLPDFGDALIVKYSDGSFETLGSLFPR